jgi:hypothetical protein
LFSTVTAFLAFVGLHPRRAGGQSRLPVARGLR